MSDYENIAEKFILSSMHSLYVLQETFLVVLQGLMAEIAPHRLRLLLPRRSLELPGLEGGARDGLPHWDAGAGDCGRHGVLSQAVVHLDVHIVWVWKHKNIF